MSTIEMVTRLKKHLANNQIFTWINFSSSLKNNREFPVRDVIKDRFVVCAKQDLCTSLQEINHERKNAKYDVNAGVVNENSCTPENELSMKISAHLKMSCQ